MTQPTAPRQPSAPAGHTPTPWKAVDIHATERGKRGIVYFQIKQAGSAKSAIGFAGVYEGKNPKADADFIIEAVNNHNALAARVSALEAALANGAEIAETYERLLKRKYDDPVLFLRSGELKLSDFVKQARKLLGGAS